MPQKLFTMSSFKLGVFRQCPRRYKYHYVDGLYDQYRKLRPYFTMGEHVHAALCAFFAGTNRDRTAGRLEKLLRGRWARNRVGFETMEQERLYGQRALSQLRWLFDTQELQAQPIMLEALHHADLSPDLRVMGRIDRVDRCPDGSLHIIDYKTGKTSRGADELQLNAYALLLATKFSAKIGRASYLFLNGDGWRSIEPREEDLAATRAALFAARDEIVAEHEFPARPDRLCRWCDFLSLCDVDVPGNAEEDADEEPF